MNKRFVVALAALAIAAGAGTAPAQVQTKNQAKCIVGVNLAASKLSAAARRVGEECIRGAVGGQDIAACIAADSKGRIAKAADKLDRVATGVCVQYPPNFGFSTASAARTSTLAQERSLAGDILGENFITGELATNPTPAQRRCRETMAKDYGKLAAAMSKGFIACKKAGLKGGSLTSRGALEDCLDQTRSSNNRLVEKASMKLMLDAVGSCDILALGELFQGECSASMGVLAFGDCVERTTRCRACMMLNQVDGMSADCDVVDDGDANGTCPPGGLPPTSSTTSTTMFDGTTTTLDTTTTTLDPSMTTTTTTTTTSSTTTTTSSTTTTTTLPSVIHVTYGNACVDVLLNVPLLGGTQRIKGPGMFQLRIDLAQVSNVPGGNGRSRVPIEITDLYFHMEDGETGDFTTVSLYPEDGLPLSASHFNPRPTVGWLAEDVRKTRNQLDVTPYGEGGTGTMTLDAWIHARIFATAFGIDASVHHDSVMLLAGGTAQIPPQGSEALVMTNTSAISVRQDSNDAQFLSSTITAVTLTFDDPVCSLE